MSSHQVPGACVPVLFSFIAEIAYTSARLHGHGTTFFYFLLLDYFVIVNRAGRGVEVKVMAVGWGGWIGPWEQGGNTVGAPVSYFVCLLGNFPQKVENFGSNCPFLLHSSFCCIVASFLLTRQSLVRS